MASIHARRGKYQVRWSFRGRQRSQTAPDRRSAERIRREVEAALAAGEDWRPARHPAPDLSEVMHMYLLACQRRGLRLETRRGYHHHLNAFVRWMEDQARRTPTLLDLSRVAVEGYHAHLLERVTPRSAALSINIITRAWRWAFEREEYEGDCPRPRRVEVDQGERKKPGRAPSWAIMDAVITSAPEWGEGPAAHDWRTVALVLQRYTGLRIGQALRVVWSDFELDAPGGPRFRLRPELGKTKAERRGRVVPVSPHLVRYLAGLGCREGFVVPDTVTGRRPRVDAMGSGPWTRAGVDPKFWRGQTSHAFREGLITELRGTGVDVLVVATFVGHLPPGVTDASYVDRVALWPALVDLVERIPAIGQAGAVVALRKGEQ